MPGLQIYAPGERALVAAADLALQPLAWARRLRAPAIRPLARVLLLRLERIGDLLMVLPAIEAARAAWPDAEIDLAVGSWNLPIAKLIPGVTHLQVADVSWLARGGQGDAWPALIGKARTWRQRRYDIVVNFEPDIRSNFLAWLTGAPRRYGYWTGGGGAWLTNASAYAPTEHVAANALRLIADAAGTSTSSPPTSSDVKRGLILPAEAKARAHELLETAGRPVIAVHASGGRASKQWHLERFASVARELAQRRGATILLTGSDEDRPQVDAVLAGLEGVPVIDVAGALDLVELATVLSRVDLLITGDTGPMHLASAMRTPLVALFGPSDPRRYGPTSPRQHVLRIDLPCSPCGQVRLPPERCRGHVPDCMDGLSVAAVVAAAENLLDNAAPLPHTVTT